MVPVEDFQWLRNGGFAQIPVLSVVELFELSDKSWNIDVVVVVEMTEPPVTRGKKNETGKNYSIHF